MRGRGQRCGLLPGALVALTLAWCGPASAAEGTPSPAPAASASGPPAWRFDHARGTLRITPAPLAGASATPGADGAPVLQLCELTAGTTQRASLAGVRLPAGWSLGNSTSGRKDCLRAAAAAAALEIPLATEHVGLRFERAAGGTGAVVEYAGQTRFVDLAGDGPVAIELGRGLPYHAWDGGTQIAYERSLLHDAAFSGSDARPWDRRFALDREHSLQPFPILPAAEVSLPFQVVYPEVFLPAGAELLVGLAVPPGDANAAPGALRVEARVTPALDGPELEAATTIVASGELQRARLVLRNAAEGRARLRLRVTAVEPRDGLRVSLVDPLLRGTAAVQPERPNVILVTLDTVRADHLSLYGYARKTTPFLEELGHESRVFDAAYAQVTNTRPSHFSIFTGRYCSELGIWNNDGPPLPQGELTLAEVLRSAGWRTGAVLSVGFLGAGSGLEQGFDEMHVPPRGVHPLGAETTRGALDFVRRHAGEPFFLWVHYFDAHLPYQPVPELRGLFWQGPPPTAETVDRSLVLPEFFDGLFVLPHVEYMTAMYDGSLRYLDDQLRAVHAALRSSGLADDTVLIVASDHGESLGEHGIYFSHAGLYEPTVHVPLLIHAPPAGVQPARVADVVENLDIAATVLDAAGLRQPPSFGGGSLLRDAPGDGTAYFEHYGQFSTGMRRGTLKTIDSRELKRHRERVGPSLRLWWEAPPLLLFDVARDPGEQTDLAASQPQTMAENLALLDAWRASVRRAPLEAPPDPKLSESLRALGYVE